MPKKLERCIHEVQGQGHSTDSAWAICRASTGLSEVVKINRQGHKLHGQYAEVMERRPANDEVRVIKSGRVHSFHSKEVQSFGGKKS